MTPCSRMFTRGLGTGYLPRIMLPLLLLAPLLSACGEDPEVPVPVLAATADGDGVLVMAPPDADLARLREHAARGGAATPGVRLQWKDDDGSWWEVMGPAGQALQQGAVYHVPADTLRDSIDRDFRFVVGALRGPLVRPADAAGADLQLTAPADVVVGSDVLVPTLSLPASPFAAGPGAVALAVDLTTTDGLESGWLSDRCGADVDLTDCWQDDEASVAIPDLAASLDLPAFRPVHDLPGTLSLSATVTVDAVGTDGLLAPVVLARAATSSLPSTGRRQYWGDLHAHSNLSHDGCEKPDDRCDHRGEAAGADFFDNARDNRLDFAAITDHAEWSRYYPDGLGGDWVDIWASQNELAEASDAHDLVTLVGYEWTNKRDKPTRTETPYEGGHKTVILRDLWVDEDFRIGATDGTASTTKGGLSAYTLGDNPQTTDPRVLFDLLDDAAATHGSTPVLTFFHHPAVEKPQGMDWANPINIPDSRYERLIEVYSEHGSSECSDRDQEECDWMVNDESFAYLVRGTVQYALAQGFRLGFVAGTDCHDARPGSIDDGPSTHGNPGAGSGAELNEQFAPGGVTAVLVPGDLDRDRLFDALMDRATFATSGPRPVVRVLATDAQGRAWLPGEVVPADAGDLQLRAIIEATGTSAVRGIRLVDASGQVLETATGDRLTTTLRPGTFDAVYLRVLFDDEADTQASDGEQRVWISPFFSEGP